MLRPAAWMKNQYEFNPFRTKKRPRKACPNLSSNKAMKSLVSLVLFALLVGYVRSCYLWGTDSGDCTEDSLDPIWRAKFMPYCQYAITFPSCVPKSQLLPPSREFPNGRWFNHTIDKKDAYVNKMAEGLFIERIALERNKTLRRAGVNEYGDKGKIRRRFYKKPDCRNAFKNYMCWLNFPRCDPTRDLTLPTCRSCCENFFISCGYERGLWRCGKSKYFNGYEPEVPTVAPDGNVTYLREYFPGQPFRENKYSAKGGSELIVCTPAVDGSASRGSFSQQVLAVVIMCIVLLSGLFVRQD